MSSYNAFSYPDQTASISPTTLLTWVNGQKLLCNVIYGLTVKTPSVLGVASLTFTWTDMASVAHSFTTASASLAGTSQLRGVAILPTGGTGDLKMECNVVGLVGSVLYDLDLMNTYDYFV